MELVSLSFHDETAMIPGKLDPMPISGGPSDGVGTYYDRYCRTARVRNAALVAIGVIAVAVVLKSVHSSPPAVASSMNNIIPYTNTIVPYTCPGTVKTSQNDKNDDFEPYLEDDERHRNKTLADFRSMPLDGWGISYRNVKAMLRPWKEEVFVKNVKSGDSIYESACGIGMNLFLTTEILQEHSINNVTVYGNDYVSESIVIANEIWASEEASRIANKGRFCQGDSSNLDFIPSASFDLVYTGYIDPVSDPLDLYDIKLSSERKWELGVKTCKSTKPDKEEIAKRAQSVQEEWFNSWVQELIRIAKPGKVIAIENGAESICTNELDWGGVDKSWWSAETVNRYGWDIDPGSIVIRDEKSVGAWRDIRYHVMMRKNSILR